MAKEYQILNLEGVVIGRFNNKKDRDNAFKQHCEYAIKREE